jgi:hypothetical protein
MTWFRRQVVALPHASRWLYLERVSELCWTRWLAYKEMLCAQKMGKMEKMEKFLDTFWELCHNEAS